MATALVPAKKSQKGQWTAPALAEAARQKADYREQVRKAVEYARAHGYGAKKAYAQRKLNGFPDVSWSVINNGLRGKISFLNGVRSEREILTQIEEQIPTKSVTGHIHTDDQQGKDERLAARAPIVLHLYDFLVIDNTAATEAPSGSLTARSYPSRISSRMSQRGSP